MKKILRIGILLTLISSVLLSCADKCTDTFEVTEYIPIVHQVADVRNSFEVLEPTDIKEPGKLYVYNDLLFVVEKYKGFHIINNSNPSAPVRIQFIGLAGCTDVVAKGTYVYANNGNDLVTIEALGNQYNLVDRIKNVFDLFETHNEQIEIGFEVEKTWVTSEEYNCEKPRWFSRQEDWDLTGNSADQGSSGRGGSTARMAVVENYIYAVDRRELMSIDVSNPSAPGPVVKNNIENWNEIETIFPMGDYLFIGTTTGMEIYNFRQNPASPTYEGTAEHIRSCDPVVVEGDIAYVTTYGGNLCSGGANLLQVFNVKNPKNPERLATYGMTHPLALGIDGTTLFICEGEHGLKIFDASNPNKILDNKLADLPGLQANDVIPLNGILIVTANDGVYQYDYTNPRNLTLLSKLYDLKTE
ncbi:MAG: hypothetical protein JJ975_02155 [Bacteroidia bacterium]|nr:hypothetical protein [Bacteroidia bacterium]